MIDQSREGVDIAAFGRRKIKPRICVADGRNHIRTFLVEALEELGFVTCECRHATDLASMLDARKPDLVILALSTDAVEAGGVRHRLCGRQIETDRVPPNYRPCVGYGARTVADGVESKADFIAVREMGFGLSVCRAYDGKEVRADDAWP